MSAHSFLSVLRYLLLPHVAQLLSSRHESQPVRQAAHCAIVELVVYMAYVLRAHFSHVSPSRLHVAQSATTQLLHTVSVVLVQAVFTPVLHVSLAAHVLHGVIPEEENVLPASHGVLHAVFVFTAQAVLTLVVHVSHGLHGVFPEEENVLPASHGILHTVFAFLVQAVLTPAVHLASAVQ